MATKTQPQAKVEGINQQIVRADIRIPVDLYSQLETIANEQGQKKHHITGRPMVSPVILELLELGLHHYSSEKSSEGDSTRLVPDNQLDIETLKDQLLTQLREELVGLAEELDKNKTQLQQALEPVSPPAVVVCEIDTTEGMQGEIPLGDDDDDDDGTISRGELIDYIRQNYPDAKINPQNLTDAVNGKSKRMPEYEKAYGFKYSGKKTGQHRFMILNKS